MVVECQSTVDFCDKNITLTAIEIFNYFMILSTSTAIKKLNNHNIGNVST